MGVMCPLMYCCFMEMVDGSGVSTNVPQFHEDGGWV